jgi:hypothetical protein
MEAMAAMECEVRDALSSLLDDLEMHIQDTDAPMQVSPLVEYSSNKIFKSTLVGQLNRNPFLSKDMLTRVRNSIYFNNTDDYLSAANSSNTCLLGLGSGCAVYMMQRSTTRVSSMSRVAGKRGWPRKNVSGPSNIYNGVDEGCWWLGHV